MRLLHVGPGFRPWRLAVTPQGPARDRVVARGRDTTIAPMRDHTSDLDSRDGLGQGSRRRAGSRVPSSLRGPARRAFFRSSAVRKLVSAARWPTQRGDAPDISHLTVFSEVADGPIQREEALFLYSLLRVVRP